MKSTRFGLALCLTFAAANANADNWPKWRGPNNDAIVTEKGLPQTLPSELKPKWTATTGKSFSTPVALNGKVYLYYLDGAKDALECFDANTGQSQWKQTYPGGYTGSYKGTRCTPTLEGDFIYTYSGNGFLACRKLADGALVWSLDVMKETGAKQKTWGISSNPIIDGDMMYMQSADNGNAAVAVNKKDGKLAWKSDARGGGYATPTLVEVGGKKQLICFGQKDLVAIDPANGKTIWEVKQDFEIEHGINATLPIYHDGKLFVSWAYKNKGCAMFELSATGAKKLWANKAVTARFQPGILENGVLYVNSEGTLQAMDWNTGNVLWQQRNVMGMGGSMVRYGDMLLLLADRGNLILGKATKEGFTKAGEAKSVVEGKQVWSAPTIYDGKLYVKGEDDLVCFDLAAK